MGVPPNHPNFNEIFHEIDHPLSGTPILGNFMKHDRWGDLSTSIGSVGDQKWLEVRGRVLQDSRHQKELWMVIM